MRVMTELCPDIRASYARRQGRFLPSQLAVILLILHSVLFGLSCSDDFRERERLAKLVDSASLTFTEEPIVALVGRSVRGAPVPYFVLYGNGSLIFGKPGPEAPRYVTILLTPDQVRQVYSSMSPDSIGEWNGRTFTPAATFLGSYFLFIREANGNYLRIATYSLPPYEKWPTELRPPEDVARALNLLAHYSAEGTSEWTPPEIEVEFQPAVPSPDDKSWWPKNWPQPKVGRSGITVLRMDGSHTRELSEYLRQYPLVRLPSGTYDVWPRYPFPHEETIKEAMKNFSFPQ